MISAVHENTQRETPKKKLNENILAMKQAGEIHSAQTIYHTEQKYEKWTLDMKIENCSRKTKRFNIRKGMNGLTERIPINCNNCDLCFLANSLKLKTKVDKAIEIAEKDSPGGEWRKKIVTPEEAKSLKKRIKRNQNGRHIETACIDTGNVEVWSYVENEEGKDGQSMEAAYGEIDNPADIDFDVLYKENRSSGKKLSTGSGLRQASPGETKKQDTIKLVIPDILIKDAARTEEAEEIIKNTNFIQIAKSPEEAKQLYLYQFQFLLEELKSANIEIAAVKMNYFNMAKADILNDWNMNVQYWQMYINDPLLKKNGEKVDISKLVHPYKWSEDNNPIVQ